MHKPFLAVLISVALASAVAAQEAEPAYGVSGTVMDESKQPIQGAKVRLLRQNENGSKLAHEAFTDASGRFTSPGWVVSRGDGAADGDWRLEVSAAHFATSCVDQLFIGFGTYDVGPVYLFPPIKVSGCVRDPGGRPIQGAAVHAALGSASWARADYAGVEPAAVTDAEGRYAFQTLPPGQVTIGVTAPGWADHVKRELRLSATEPNTVDFALKPALAINGRLLNDQKAAISGAIVEPLEEKPGVGFWRTECVAGKDGAFSIEGRSELPTDGFLIQARGYIPQWATLQSSKDVQEIPLRPSQSFTLKLEPCADPSHKPQLTSVRIRNSNVQGMCGNCDQLNWSSAQEQRSTVERTGDSSWKVYWEAAMTSPYGPRGGKSMTPRTLVVELTDGAILSHRIPENTPIDSATVVTLRPEVPGALSGQVVDSASGRPVAGIRAMLNFWTVTQPHMDAITDADGRFKFSGLAPSNVHTVRVRNSLCRGETELIKVKAGETSTVRLSVKPTPLIRGRITIGEKAPGEQIIVGLGEFQPGHAVEGGWFGLGSCDAAGSYSVPPHYDRTFTVVPKRRTSPSQGGYRKFRSEFPATPPGNWPWEVKAPDTGVATLDLDLPADYDKF